MMQEGGTDGSSRRARFLFQLTARTFRVLRDALIASQVNSLIALWDRAQEVSETKSLLALFFE